MNNKEQKTILLVDDEVTVALKDAMQLTNYGYNVITAYNGKKAIEVVNSNSPPIDLILMDINLTEEMDGTEAAKIILKDHDIPLLFHSTYTDREVVDKTENITSYGYVVKNGITVLDASIKMAFKLHESYQNLKIQEIETGYNHNKLQMYEKRYRRLFESAKDGILILNADNGMITEVNPFLTELLGYSREEFLEKKIWDLSAFKNIDYSKRLYKELQEKKYVRYEDLPLETSDGKQIHVEFVSNVYQVDNESVIQCNIRDITNRVKHEKILSDDINAKNALLKEIQHRTKNSFSMITSLIHLRADTETSEETKNVLDELNLRVRSISDLYSLLHDTDSFFNVPLNIYCDKVIESTLKLSNKVTLNKNIAEITVPSKNAATIGMILVELITNSIKYAFPDTNTGIINVDLKVNGFRILLTVQDNGIGLRKDFDINQVTSLGLHLVNLMVSQLNGKIKFFLGIGTKIEIEIPI